MHALNLLPDNANHMFVEKPQPDFLVCSVCLFLNSFIKSSEYLNVWNWYGWVHWIGIRLPLYYFSKAEKDSGCSLEKIEAQSTFLDRLLKEVEELDVNDMDFLQMSLILLHVIVVGRSQG